ncbi:MAG: thrombospondin type 3 repeat-containing protein [Deltaproteobacteria bacterium]|nr:thrombospondin type 3 repeat-containing protein [Deltaproteobacteria bacterium]
MKNRLALLVIPCLFLFVCRCQCEPEPGTDAGPGVDANGGQDAGPGVDRQGTDASGSDASGSDASQPDSATAVETCTGAPTTVANPGECEVVAGNTTTMVVGTVLTPGRVYERGAVVFNANGVIDCVGCDCFGSAGAAKKIICNGVAISPGLINTHDHMGWMADIPRAPTAPGTIRYEHRHDWRKGDSSDGEPKITTAGGATTDQKIYGELRFVLGGATSINGSGTAPGFLRNLDNAGGLEGLPEGKVLYSTFPLGDSDGTQLSTGCGYPSYDSASAVASANAYTPHVSEGIDDYAFNEFLCLSGNAAGGQDLLGANAGIIHGVGFSASAIAELTARGAKLIWSPRTNICLYGETAAVTLYHRLGMPIGLGSDWIPSGSMNMLRELACAAFLNDNYFGGYFSEEDLWRMATIGAARSTGVANSIGVLQAGKIADLALFRVGQGDHYSSVVRAEPDDVVLVIRGGKVLSGRAALVAALESNCDPLDVCGSQYRVCVQREVGKSLSTLLASVGQMYDLVVCGTPPNEPTCVPYRGENESVMGSTVYTEPPNAADLDGDGIANEQDNCPTIFNPKRPFDHGKQGDFDNDLIGDVCDPCPLDANTDQCTVFDPDDADRDGVLDTVDNCPGVPNPAPQSDRDNDGHGDPCDPCPDVANPGNAGCPTTIHDIQDIASASHPDVGSRVAFECAVTAVGLKGIWCQERSGGAWSGIYVYANATPTANDGTATPRTPVRGDDLRIDGVYSEYFDMTEIESPTLTWLRSGAVLAPAVVDAADVANGGSLAEQYEGVLIRVNDVTVTVQNADAPGDYDEFAVTGGLRVDDLIYQELDNTFAVGTSFSALVGPLHYSFSNFKILPRDANDVMSGPATLARFSDSLVYARVGAAATSTVPHGLFVEMTRPVEADTTVALALAPGGIAQIPASVVVPNGASRAEVLVQGLAAAADPAHITATIGSASAGADVRVLADDQTVRVVSIAPATATVLTGATTSFEVGLDLPAPLGAATVDLNAGQVGTVMRSMTIPFNAMSGSFELVAAATPVVGSVSATLNHTVSATVTVVDPSALVQDLSGYQLIQTESARTFTIPASTTVPIGGYLIVARNAAKASFESFWQVTLGSNVVYLNSGDTFPMINGAETYSLKRAGGVDIVDGPTVALTIGKCYQRKLPLQSANSEAAWNIIGAAAGSGSNPGGGQILGTPPNGAYISEFCDTIGSGTYNNEFVEIYVDGPVE